MIRRQCKFSANGFWVHICLRIATPRVVFLTTGFCLDHNSEAFKAKH